MNRNRTIALCTLHFFIIANVGSFHYDVALRSIEPKFNTFVYQPKASSFLYHVQAHSHSKDNESENPFHGEMSEDDKSVGSTSEDILDEVDINQPTELMVMKDLLGINIFTYALAAAIAFFFSMNIILGPGWLGNSIGMEGTGTFQEVSDSLPDIIDLSNSDFLI